MNGPPNTPPVERARPAPPPGNAPTIPQLPNQQPGLATFAGPGPNPPGPGMPGWVQQQLAAMAATAAADREAAEAARIAARVELAVILRERLPNVDVLTRAEIIERYQARPQFTLAEHARWLAEEREAARRAALPADDPSRVRAAAAAVAAAVRAQIAKRLTREAIVRKIFLKVTGLEVLDRMATGTTLGNEPEPSQWEDNRRLAESLRDKTLLDNGETLGEYQVRILAKQGWTSDQINAARGGFGPPVSWAAEKRDP